MLQKLKARFVKSELVSRVRQISKKIVFPGFEGISLFEATVFFARAIQKGAITTRASSLAFKFFLALFPAILFLFSLIPYIPIDNFQDYLLMQLKAVMPMEAYELSKSTIESIISEKRGGILSFGFLLSLYFATNGINAMISAFNQSYLDFEKRNFLKQRLVSIGLGIILALLLVVAITLIVFGTKLIANVFGNEYLNKDLIIGLVQVGRWLIIVALFYFSISFIYYIGPSRKTKWKFFSAGSSLATILMVLVSFGFAFFVNNFGQYNKLYGSIGSLIVIMLWIYFNSLIMLVGFELNASIQSAKRKKLTNKAAENLS